MADDITMELTDSEAIRQDIMQRAYALRAFLDAHADDVDDEQALSVPDLIPLWNSGMQYEVGDRVRYGRSVYRVLQGHTSQLDWTPDVVPALYALLRTSQEQLADSEGIEEWSQPTAENPYSRGEKVLHNGSIWESLVDGNVWEPSATTEALSLWKRID